MLLALARVYHIAAAAAAAVAAAAAAVVVVVVFAVVVIVVVGVVCLCPRLLWLWAALATPDSRSSATIVRAVAAPRGVAMDRSMGRSMDLCVQVGGSC